MTAIARLSRELASRATGPDPGLDAGDGLGLGFDGIRWFDCPVVEIAEEAVGVRALLIADRVTIVATDAGSPFV